MERVPYACALATPSLAKGTIVLPSGAASALRGWTLVLAFAASAAAQSLLSQADQARSKGDVAGFKRF